MSLSLIDIACLALRLHIFLLSAISVWTVNNCSLISDIVKSEAILDKQQGMLNIIYGFLGLGWLQWL